MFVCLFVRWFVILVLVLLFVIVFLLRFFFITSLVFTRSTFHMLASWSIYSCPFFSVWFATADALNLTHSLYLLAIPFKFSLYILFYLRCRCWFCVEHSVEMYMYNTHWYYYYTHLGYCCSLRPRRRVHCTQYTFVHVGRKTIVLSTQRISTENLYIHFCWPDDYII